MFKVYMGLRLVVFSPLYVAEIPYLIQTTE